MNPRLEIKIPGTNQYIHVGDTVKLGRFQTDRWRVNHDWFEFDGNRPMCGWYLTNMETLVVKPLLKTDLHDIYVIEY